MPKRRVGAGGACQWNSYKTMSKDNDCSRGYWTFNKGTICAKKEGRGGGWGPAPFLRGYLCNTPKSWTGPVTAKYPQPSNTGNSTKDTYRGCCHPSRLFLVMATMFHTYVDACITPWRAPGTGAFRICPWSAEPSSSFPGPDGR